jgi:hypothetical protein
MDLAETEETQRFLSAVWIRWGEGILRAIASHYKLSPEQRDALIAVLSKPNDWIVSIEPSWAESQ